MDVPKLLSIDELSEHLGISPATLRDWRKHGKGPRATKVGPLVRYHPDDVARWLDDRREPMEASS